MFFSNWVQTQLDPVRSQHIQTHPFPQFESRSFDDFLESVIQLINVNQSPIVLHEIQWNPNMFSHMFSHVFRPGPVAARHESPCPHLGDPWEIHAMVMTWHE